MLTAFNPQINFPTLPKPKVNIHAYQNMPKFGILKGGLDEVLLSSKHPIFETLNNLIQYLDRVKAHQAAKAAAANDNGTKEQQLTKLIEELPKLETERKIWEDQYESEVKFKGEEGFLRITEDEFKTLKDSYIEADKVVKEHKQKIGDIQEEIRTREEQLADIPDEEEGMALIRRIQVEILTLDNFTELIQVAAKIHNTNLPVTPNDEIGKALLTQHEKLTG